MHCNERVTRVRSQLSTHTFADPLQFVTIWSSLGQIPCRNPHTNSKLQSTLRNLPGLCFRVYCIVPVKMVGGPWQLKISVFSRYLSCKYRDHERKNRAPQSTVWRKNSMKLPRCVCVKDFTAAQADSRCFWKRPSSWQRCPKERSQNRDRVTKKLS